MVKAKKKPLDEIKDAVAEYERILNVGCGGCASVCLAGGQKEVAALNNELKMAFKLDGRARKIDGYTVERQCNLQFLDELDALVENYDCLMSMACGAGAAFMAERYPKIPVFPAVNTLAIGTDREIGMYDERCRACGQCVIGYTGGICPVVCCAKGLFNGPCGGVHDGQCEVGHGISCAWCDIYNRLKEQKRLDNILKIRMPMQWQNQIRRIIIQEPYEKKYYR